MERGAGYLLDSTPEYLEAGRKKVKDECEGMPSTLKQLRSWPATLDDGRVCSINNKYYKGTIIYIRAIKIVRDGEQYGTYYQAVRSYREKGKVKQEVVHLSEYQTAEAALNAWPGEITELRSTRPKHAQKLQDKLDRLQELTGELN